MSASIWGVCVVGSRGDVGRDTLDWLSSFSFCARLCFKDMTVPWSFCASFCSLGWGIESRRVRRLTGVSKRFPAELRMIWEVPGQGKLLTVSPQETAKQLVPLGSLAELSVGLHLSLFFAGPPLQCLSSILLCSRASASDTLGSNLVQVLRKVTPREQCVGLQSGDRKGFKTPS